MSENENEYYYTPPQQQQSSIAEGDIVSCINKDSVNFCVWGEVVEIIEVDGVSVASIKIKNPEFPKQTGWIIQEAIDNLELV